MADPLYPNVPIAVGVPPVSRLFDVASRAAIQAIDAGSLLSSVSALLGSFTDGGPQWGIFDDGGQPVIDAEVVSCMNLRKDFRIADFPIEDGEFASYNKVRTPFDAPVTFVQAGTTDDRGGFLQQVDSICESLDLFTVVTPEFSYDSANIIGYEYRRSVQNGASMLTVEVFCREVRLVQPGQFSQTKTTDQAQDTAAQPAQDQGTVSTSPPTSSQSVSALQATNDGRRDRDNVLVRDGRRDQG